MTAPAPEAARRMGKVGAADSGIPHDDAERLAFEAWMAGHCWELGADWNGKSYISGGEAISGFGYVCPQAMTTRRMWAAWRDRAALAAPVQAPPTWECKAGGLRPLTDAQYQQQPERIQRHYTRIVQAPAGWQPISTAPKDGSLFLCWVLAVACGESDEGQQYQTDVSQPDFCQWHSFDEAPDGGWFEPCCGQISERQAVTHWMPLPPAPQQDGGTNSGG